MDARVRAPSVATDDALASSTMTLGELRRARERPDTHTMGESDYEPDTRDRSSEPGTLAENLSRMTAAKLAGQEHEPVRLGDYELERLVGRGGMGQVFAARSLQSGRGVALKVLHRSSAAALLHLKREFRVLAGIEHPNLVRLDELVVPPNDEAFFTMEMVTGVPFVEYVRGHARRGKPPNMVRLRRALTQLLSALACLHDNGFVHRDLKPSNVLVTEDGRVVVLDFGLVHEVTSANEADDHILGTPAYMAPEQAARQAAGPPADLYAVGVILFECLCGTRPFVGNPDAVLAAKLEGYAPDPAELVPECDADMLALCRELLERSAEARPSASNLLDRLQRTRRTVTLTTTFVGRANEIAELDAAVLELHTKRQPVLTLLHGPSGQGKSRLLSRWVSTLEGDELVLKGRCLERESVPYKGLDAVIDALSGYLRQLPKASLDALEPAHVAELARLFPVLGDIWRDAGGSPEGLEPVERRERAVSSLRELLARLARMRTIVIVLDDFHWADLDSAIMLEQLVDDLAGPSLVLVVSYRQPPEAGPAVAQLQGMGRSAPISRRQLALGPLSDNDARELVVPALAHESAALAKATTIIRQAAGNPLHLLELLRARGETADADFDRLIARRILELEPARRRVLALAALAGPIDRSALEAAGCLSVDIDALVTDGLLSMSSSDGDQVEAARDAVARFAIAELDAEELPRYHLELANALVRVGASPELLAKHFERGGQRDRAFVHAQQAAEQAMNALAFRRAADWFERCIAWLPEGGNAGKRRRQLERQLVTAYASSGRLVDAATVLLRQADEPGIDDANALRMRAVEYLLKAGRMNDGLREAIAVLAAVGLPMPSRIKMVFNMLGYRPRLARDLAHIDRGMTPRDDTLLREQARVCQALALGFTAHEALLTVHFLGNWRRLSIEIGDRKSCAAALGFESVFCAAMGWTERAETLTRRGRDLADDDQNVALWLDVMEVFAEANADNWGRALTTYNAVMPKLEARPDLHWERRLATDAGMWTFAEAGHYREAIALGRRQVQLGIELGDLKQFGDASAFVAWALVCVGELGEADRVIAESDRRRLEAADRRYLFRDMFLDFARIRRLLRKREWESAASAARQLRSKMKHDGLWHMRAYRQAAMALIAGAELQLWLRAPSSRQRRRVQKISRELSRFSIHQRGNAATIEAVLCQGGNDAARASTLLAEAAECFANSGADAALAAVQIRRAELVGGEEADRLRAAAEAYFRRESIAEPEALVAMFVPDRS
jgi:serine/threonine protein kinase